MTETSTTPIAATTCLLHLLADLRQWGTTHYGNRLVGMVLYGSQARGDAVAGSDVDMLVILNGEPSPTDKTAAREQVYTLLLRYDMLVSLVYTTYADYQQEQSPLMINIRREGRWLTGDSSPHPPVPQPQLLPVRYDYAREKHAMHPEQTALLQKAAESLHWAKEMAKGGQYGFAASRAYYTMFYVAQAFLLSKGLSFSKHSAVIAAFGKHFAHPGIVPIAFHRQLIDAQELRLIGDYASKATVLQQDVAQTLTHAESFLAWAHEMLGDTDTA